MTLIYRGMQSNDGHVWTPIQVLPMVSFGSWRLIREVKQETRLQLRTSGFALIADQLDGVAIPPSVDGLPGYTEDYIDTLWSRAEAAGELSDEIIRDLSERVTGLREDGPILGFFKRVIEWLRVPENREKVLAIVKMIMMILVMFI